MLFYLFPFLAFLSTFLWHLREPYCSDGQKLWHDQGVFCYFGNWLILGYYSWRIVWGLRGVQCWILPPLVSPIPRVSSPTLVYSWAPQPWLIFGFFVTFLQNRNSLPQSCKNVVCVSFRSCFQVLEVLICFTKIWQIIFEKCQNIYSM